MRFVMEKPIAIQQNTIKHETVQTVNARELHAFLEVNSNFRDWIKNRIKEYNFQENQDFIIFAKILAKSLRGRPSMEYHLTLDMAKKLSMLERNEKGKEARQYFIECERRVKQFPQLNLANALENPLFVKKLLLESVTQLETLKSEVVPLNQKQLHLKVYSAMMGSLVLQKPRKYSRCNQNSSFNFYRKKVGFTGVQQVEIYFLIKTKSKSN